MQHSNSTSNISPTQPHPLWPAPFLVSPANTLIQENVVCPRAQTMLADRVDRTGTLLIGLTCKKWSCRPCSTAKIKRLAILTRLAAPNRLLTLTVDPALYESPRAAFEATAVRVPELIRSLRLRFGSIEYLRVTELTRKGFPHYHLLLRSKYLPHTVVKSRWRELTQASIVDLRQVGNNFGAYTYLTKYLTKMHALTWTERHVSYSKHFFPKQDYQKEELGNHQTLACHPYSWLADHMADKTILQIGPLSWILADTTFTPSPDF